MLSSAKGRFNSIVQGPSGKHRQGTLAGTFAQSADAVMPRRHISNPAGGHVFWTIRCDGIGLDRPHQGMNTMPRQKFFRVLPVEPGVANDGVGKRFLRVQFGGSGGFCDLGIVVAFGFHVHCFDNLGRGEIAPAIVGHIVADDRYVVAQEDFWCSHCPARDSGSRLNPTNGGGRRQWAGPYPRLDSQPRSCRLGSRDPTEGSGDKFMYADISEARFFEIAETIRFGVGEPGAAIDRFRHPPKGWADGATEIIVQCLADQMHFAAGQQGVERALDNLGDDGAAV